MSQKRRIQRNAKSPWDNKHMEGDVLVVTGDLAPIPKRSSTQPAQHRFLAKTDIHLQGSLNSGAELDSMPPYTQDKAATHAVTIDGDVHGTLIVRGNSTVHIGGSVHGTVNHFGNGDITVEGDVAGRISAKNALSVGGAITEEASLSYDLQHITAHEIAFGVSLPKHAQITTTIPHTMLTPTSPQEPSAPRDPLDIISELGNISGFGNIRSIIEDLTKPVINVEPEPDVTPKTGDLSLGTPPHKRPEKS